MIDECIIAGLARDSNDKRPPIVLDTDAAVDVNERVIRGDDEGEACTGSHLKGVITTLLGTEGGVGVYRRVGETHPKERTGERGVDATPAQLFGVKRSNCSLQGCEKILIEFGVFCRFPFEDERRLFPQFGGSDGRLGAAFSACALCAGAEVGGGLNVELCCGEWGVSAGLTSPSMARMPAKVPGRHEAM